jgi:hypothetical protein
MKLQSIPHLKTIHLQQSTWYRAIDPAFLSTPIDHGYTRRLRSRFNPGGIHNQPLFSVLYFCDAHHTCLREVEAEYRWKGAWYSVPQAANSWHIAAMQVHLQQVIDLTNTQAQKLIGASAQCLTGDWVGYQDRMPHSPVPAPTGVAPTQELGAEVFRNTSVEGILTLSSREPDRKCLVVLPQQFAAGSFVEFKDQRTRQIYRIGTGGKRSVTQMP